MQFALNTPLRLGSRTWEAARTRSPEPGCARVLDGGSILCFARKTTGGHQAGAAALALLIAALHLAPIDLQRRIVDSAISNGSRHLLFSLAAVYLAVVIVEIGFKYALLVYQGWMSERAIRVARSQVARDLARDGCCAGKGGQAVNVIGAEIEHVCGFVGSSIPQAVMNLAVVVGTAAYMLWAEPMIAACGFLLLVPQVAAAPLLQRRLNRLVASQLSLVRRLGDEVVARSGGLEAQLGTITSIFDNRMRFYICKFGLKALQNLANALSTVAILVVGAYAVISGQTTIGTVLAFVVGFERLSGPMRELLTFYRLAAQAQVQHGMIVDWMARRRFQMRSPEVGDEVKV